MRTIKQFLILALMSLIFVNCNSGSSSDLSDTLSGNTFLIEGLEDVMDDVSASCGSSSGNASRSEASESVVNTAALSINSTADSDVNPSSSSSSDYEISFGSSTYSVTSDGNEVMDGTWEATDGNTVEIELYGDTYLIDVDVNEDDDTVTVNLNDSQDLECDSSTSSNSSTNSGSSASSEDDDSWAEEAAQAEESEDDDSWGLGF